MRTQLAAACAGLALMAATATAQTPRFEAAKSKVSRVEFWSSNNGPFGINPGEGAPGLIYPRGSKKMYLFGSGLWFGAQKRVEGSLRPLTFVTYNPNSGSSWATPGEYGDDSTSTLPRIYNSVDYDYTTGAYIASDSQLPAWPLWMGRWRAGTPMIPGIFKPLDADRTGTPAFVKGGDEQIVTRFNDGNLSRYEVRDSAITGLPLGLQFQQRIFAWKEGLYSSAVMVQHEIVNISPDTLFDCIAAQISDPDIGQVSRNRTRFWSERPELRTGYAWADQQLGEYGVLAMALIEAPVTDANGFVDISRRSEYRDQGRVGAFPEWTAFTDPSLSTQRYEFMSTPQFTTGDSIGEMRTLLASNKFSMRPGDTAYYTMIYVVTDTLPALGKAVMGDGGRHLSGVPMTMAAQTQLERVITSITIDYYRNAFISTLSSTAPEALATGMNLAAAPNPAGDRTTIRMNLAGRGNATLRISNSLGEVVIVRDLGNRGPGTFAENVDAAALPAGLYFAMVEEGGRSSVIRFAVVR